MVHGAVTQQNWGSPTVVCLQQYCDTVSFNAIQRFKSCHCNTYLKNINDTSSCYYDAVSDLMHNWVPQRPDFKSALRVVKMVLNNQCYSYLWLTMWFHAKNLKKHSKNQNRWFYNVNSAPKLRNYRKSPKNRSLNRDLLNFVYRYGIFQMPPGESSCPGGSEYVWQRGGRGCFRLS